MRNSEHELQAQCVAWFRRTFPNLSKNFFAVPNGGARNIITGAMLKREGVLAGVADLILLYPKKTNGLSGEVISHALLIELKTPRGVLSKSQQEFSSHIVEYNYMYEVVRDYDQFTNTINRYLEGIPKRITGDGW